MLIQTKRVRAEIRQLQHTFLSKFVLISFNFLDFQYFGTNMVKEQDLLDAARKGNADVIVRALEQISKRTGPLSRYV